MTDYRFRISARWIRSIFKIDKNMKKNKKSIIWVIGGAGHLGQSIVRFLLGKNKHVLCADLAGKAREFATQVNKKEQLIPVELDVSDEEMLFEFVRHNVIQYGIPDGLVILTYGAAGRSFDDLDAESFNRAGHLGVTSTFLLAREVGRAMEKNGKGSIVLFSSMYGAVSPDPRIYESPMQPNPVEYGIGKAGIVQLTKYLAVHWARKGIRCNCISPGPFPNQMVINSHPQFIERLNAKVPMGRVGLAEEIAGPVHFLLSDDSSYVTGHNLFVDGGWTIW